MRFFIYIAFGVLPIFAYSQDSTSGLQAHVHPEFRDLDTALRSRYPFVRYNVNQFKFHSENSPNFELLSRNMDALIQSKKGKLNFYHLGGSHVQADIYTHDMRTFLEGNWSGLPGERGWVFPFDLANTNNPSNYEFSSPNKWRAYRSVVHKPSQYKVDYGLMGAVVMCADSVITIRFKHDRTLVGQPTNHIRIFHNIGDFPYWMHFGADELLVWKTTHNPEIGYTDVYLTDPVDTLNIQFQPIAGQAPELEIYGFILMNDEPGISYTSIGINGAGLYTYLANDRFEEQLKTYPPDFFAFSVGTNDGNTTYDKFKPEVYKQNLEKMMQMVLRANPNCALLLTVPNDSYYRKRYLNKNIDRERTVIIELAKQYNMAVWDFYGIMGELGSSMTWFHNDLMRSDLVHFTGDGYHLKGDLYIDAFQKFLDQMNVIQADN